MIGSHETPFNHKSGDKKKNNVKKNVLKYIIVVMQIYYFLEYKTSNKILLDFDIIWQKLDDYKSNEYYTIINHY